VGLIMIDNPIFPVQQGLLSEKTVDSVLLSLLISKSKKARIYETSQNIAGI